MVEANYKLNLGHEGSREKIVRGSIFCSLNVSDVIKHSGKFPQWPKQQTGMKGV